MIFSSVTPHGYICHPWLSPSWPAVRLPSLPGVYLRSCRAAQVFVDAFTPASRFATSAKKRAVTQAFGRCYVSLSLYYSFSFMYDLHETEWSELRIFSGSHTISFTHRFLLNHLQRWRRLSAFLEPLATLVKPFVEMTITPLDCWLSPFFLPILLCHVSVQLFPREVTSLYCDYSQSVTASWLVQHQTGVLKLD